MRTSVYNRPTARLVWQLNGCQVVTQWEKFCFRFELRLWNSSFVRLKTNTEITWQIVSKNIVGYQHNWWKGPGCACDLQCGCILRSMVCFVNVSGSILKWRVDVPLVFDRMPKAHCSGVHMEENNTHHVRVHTHTHTHTHTHKGFCFLSN